MENNYIFAECDTGALAEKYGTPLYVVSEDYIIERCDEINRDFTEKYDNTRAVFASKAFQTLEMCRIIDRCGLGMDAVSEGEIFTALKAGVDPQNIVFHGNAKSESELRYAVENSIGTIVVDNKTELMMLNDIAGEAGIKQKILFRVTPGVDSHTHQYISTAQEDSKFGIAVDQVLDEGYAELAIELENVDLYGFHFHVGSQLIENDSHLMAVDVILKLVRSVREKLGFEIKELNLGGGFAVHYEGDPERQSLSYYTDPMMKKIDDFYRIEGTQRPTIVIEPGRWIIAEAGITLYTVTSVKTNAAGRRYIGVDGGLPDNPRTALYQAQYEIEPVNRQGEEKTETYTVAGKCCESGDILIWDAKLPQMKIGDNVAVLCTGAYNYSMASNYNRIPKPAVVMLRDGKDRLSVKRETLEDLIRNEL